MKITHLLCSLALPLCISSSANAALLAFWDFNDGFAVPDETSQIVHNASQGTGTLYQQRADTDGNGKGGIAYVNAANGINAIDGKSMAWDDVAKGGANDAEFFIVINTSGYTDITIRFDLEGNAVDPVDGIQSYDLKYATAALVDITDPDVVGTIKDFAGGISTSLENNTAINNPIPYAEITVDLSATTAINNQSYVALRFDDWKENDDLRIDNVMVTGTAVPEPSSVALSMIGSFALLLRRRR